MSDNDNPTTTSGRASGQNGSAAPSGGKKAADPQFSWQPYKPGCIAASLGAEAPFQAKYPGKADEVTLILNGHRQLLHADTRHLAEPPEKVLIPTVA